MVIGIEAQYRVRRCKAGLAIIWWFKKKQNGIRPCVLCNINLCEAEGRIWDLCYFCGFLFPYMDQQLERGSCTQDHAWPQSLVMAVLP